MPLNTAQRRQFAEQGYTTEPGFFDARELAALLAELDRLKRIGALRNVATEGDGATPARSVANLQLCPCAPRSPLIRALPFAPKVLAAVGALVGEPILFRLDQIFLKPGGHGAGTAWHQDHAYWPSVVDPSLGVGMWTALHPATVANGTMHIVPGSHRMLREHRRDPNSDHHIFTPHVRDDEALPIELPAGGVLFFNYGIAHCTKANRTDRERAGLALHFINTAGAPPEFLADPLCVHLSGSRASGGRTEYGETVAGTWPGEVERALAGAPAPAH